VADVADLADGGHRTPGVGTRRSHSRPRRRLAVLVGAVALLGLVAAACQPVAESAPQKKKSSSTTKKSGSSGSGGGGGSSASACTSATEAPSASAAEATPPEEPSAEVPTTEAVPTPQAPVEYVAVIDDPGPSAPDIVTFTASSEAARDAEVADLEQDGAVIALEPNGTVEAAALPDPSDDADYPSQWALPAAGFTTSTSPASWAAGFDGTGQVVAVLDTGVEATQPDLVGQVLQGQDFVDPTNVASDFARKDLFNGTHGTAVAGVVAELDNTIMGIGGAPAAQILPVRVLDNNGSGDFANVALGIQWAADHGATVINMSFGAKGGQCSSSIQTQINYARSKNIVVVAAAGNNSSDQLGAPSGSGGVITVGASTQSNTKASYSNYGKFVDIGAPGDNIFVTKKTGTFLASSGTSFSAPFVSAAAALLKQKCGPGYTPDQVLNRLKASASVNVSGLGAKLLDVDAATAAC